MDIQMCEKCKQDLALSSFDKSGNSYRHTCKSCRYNRTKELRNQRALKNANKIRFKKNNKCDTCNKTKPVNYFNRSLTTKDGISSTCRGCYSKNRKLTVDIQPIINLLIKSCNTCKHSKSISEFRKTKKSADGHFHKCNTCWKPSVWTKEKQKLSEKRYCDKNKDKIKAKWKRDGQKLHRKIKSRLSNRIKDALKAYSLRKDNTTMSYLGCSHIFLRKWFEFLFVEGMNWDNIGEWHIDHVIPCASYDLTNEEDIKLCFSWKNIRPCWQQENLEKGSQTIPEVVKNHESKMKEFLNNPLLNPSGNREGGAN
jgi:hypothetical protein